MSPFKLIGFCLFNSLNVKMYFTPSYIFVLLKVLFL